jgi:hypothetical protein
MHLGRIAIQLHASAPLLFSRRATATALVLPHSRRAAFAMAATPPVARKVPRELAQHGDVRVDNYYWLRDDSRSHPDVLAHLRAENLYTATIMSGMLPIPSLTSFRVPSHILLDRSIFLLLSRCCFHSQISIFYTLRLLHFDKYYQGFYIE